MPDERQHSSKCRGSQRGGGRSWCVAVADWSNASCTRPWLRLVALGDAWLRLVAFGCVWLVGGWFFKRVGIVKRGLSEWGVLVKIYKAPSGGLVTSSVKWLGGKGRFWRKSEHDFHHALDLPVSRYILRMHAPPVDVGGPPGGTGSNI